MSDALLLALAALGLAGPISHAMVGWPRLVRVRAMRAWRRPGRHRRAWRHAWSCAMCLSFWLGAALGMAGALALGEWRCLLAGPIAAGLAWGAITVRGG